MGLSENTEIIKPPFATLCNYSQAKQRRQYFLRSIDLIHHGSRKLILLIQ